MRNRFGLPEELKRKVVAIYDAPKFGDRYTVYFSRRISPANFGKHGYIAMSANPFHPQGIGQHGEGQLGKHNGKAIKFDNLPEDCKRAVYQDLDLKFG